MGEYIEPPADPTPTWDKLMRQLGSRLDAAVAANQWCIDNCVEDGSDYLKVWLANSLRLPERRLPVLAMHGGDTIAMSLLSEAFATVVNWPIVLVNELIGTASRSHLFEELGGLKIAVINDINFTSNDRRRRLLKRFAGDPEITLSSEEGWPSQRQNFARFIITAPFRMFLGPPDSNWITPFYVEDYELTTPQANAALNLIAEESVDIVVKLYNYDLQTPYNNPLAMPALSGDSE